MIKKRFQILLTLMLLCGFATNAQGIEFRPISLEEALVKAKVEDKLVFVDFYTMWCVPCKQLSKMVFPLPEVGALYNKAFVSIKLNAEKEGLEAAKKYNVSAYPTLLFLTPDGNIAYKDTGAKPVKDILELGYNAITSVTSKYSLEKLQNDFAQKQTDEHFLKVYVEKLKEYGQSPVYGIEAWLKVQTEIKENDVDMMEYLINNAKYLVAGGKAEEILYANFNTYMDIATKSEEKTLNQLKLHLVLNTKVQALDVKSPELMLLFINAWQKLPEKYKSGNVLEHKLLYYSLLKDNKNYKATAIQYMDSLMAANPIGYVREQDQNTYQQTAKKYEGSNNPKVVEALKELKIRGGYSSALVNRIDDVGQAYLSKITKNKEYKIVENWIDYGYKAQSGSYYIDNLNAHYYYAKGKIKKAIQYKEQALNNWPKSDKKLSTKAYELEQIKNGSYTYQ